MKTRNILAVLLLFCVCIISSAQSPGRLNYQGVARDASGEPYTNQLIGLRFTILNSSSVSVYTEIQSFTTNEFGLINTGIGEVNQAAFATVDWGADTYSLKVELDLENNGSWEMETTSALSSVPYALYGEDGDTNPSNELQTLVLSGNQLSITDGNTVLLPEGTDTDPQNEIQTLTISGNILSISDGNNVTLPTDGDGDSTNELQTLVLSGHQISISDGNSIVLPTDPDEDTSNELQTLSISGSQISISNGNSITLPTDLDEDSSNELQTLSITGNQLSISSGNTIDLPTGTVSPWLTSGSNIYYNGGLVGIGTEEPIYDLHISDTTTNTSSSVVLLETLNAKMRLLAYEKVPSVWIQAGMKNIAESAVDLGFSGMNGAPVHMMIKASGKIGMGTTEPDAKLQVAYSEQRTLAAGHWLDLSSCPGGYGMLGGNAYLRYSDNSFRFARTHPSIGASGIGINALGGSPGWNSVGIFSNAGPSVENEAFTPNWIASFRANGNVGIGTITPESRLEVQGDLSWADEDPLFEVKNKDGVPVFAVYNNGVRILVNDDPADLVKARTRGGFAVAGFDKDEKGFVETYNFMRITPDSIRFNVDNSAIAKAPGTRGGFAVGGFDRDEKATINEDFMYLTPQGSGNGNYNTLLGYKAGDNETGEDNVMIGYAAGINSTYASNNVFIGKNAGGNSNGSYNVFMGEAAGRYEGGQYNVYIGHAAGSKVPSDPRFPYESVSYNTAIGYFAGLRNTGQGLVAMGWSAGQSNRGDLNTFIGAESGMYNTTGVNNTFLGCEAGWKTTSGSTNVFIGTCAGRDNTTGGNNVFIGNYAGATQNVTDRLFIDNNETNLPLIFGAFDINLVRIHGNLQYTGTLSHYSDINMKEGISTLSGTLEKIQKIRGISFYWNKESQASLDMGKQRQIGVIAQEVENMYPELISVDESGHKLVDYTMLTPILLEAVKEQQEIIEDQDNRIIGLENELDELKAMVTTLLELQK